MGNDPDDWTPACRTYIGTARDWGTPVDEIINSLTMQTIEVPPDAVSVAIDFASPLAQPTLLPALVFTTRSDGSVYATLHAPASVATLRIIFPQDSAAPCR